MCFCMCRVAPIGGEVQNKLKHPGVTPIFVSQSLLRCSRSFNSSFRGSSRLFFSLARLFKNCKNAWDIRHFLVSLLPPSLRDTEPNESIVFCDRSVPQNPKTRAFWGVWEKCFMGFRRASRSIRCCTNSKMSPLDPRKVAVALRSGLAD